MSGRAKRDERGFIMIMTGVCIVLFMLMIGFAVDLGTWYLRASKLQRAADVAALSGAALLPDTSAAQSGALATFQRNGLTTAGSVTVSATADTSGVVKTSAADSNVPSYFLKFILDHISITRTSQAQQLTSIPLGSPYNIFGYGDQSSMSVTGPVPVQNFWAAVNGRCTPKEDGDYFSSKWDANKGTGVHYCDSGGGYQKTNSTWEDGGYNFGIDIPAAATTNAFDITLWDPNYSTTSGSDAVDNMPSDTDGGFSTGYRLWDTKGTTTETDDTIVSGSKTSGIFVQGTAPGRSAWYVVYTTPATYAAAGRHYRLQVLTDPNNDAGHVQTGVNGYAVMAPRTGTHTSCDSRSSTTCPSVYALGAMSLFNTFSSSDAQAGTRTFYLAKIDPAFSTSTVTLYLWDPGEGASSMQILMPDGTPAPFTWTASSSVCSATYNSGGTVTALTNLSDPAVAGFPNKSCANGIVGTTKFNDYLVTINLTIPSSYASTPGDQWWQVKYSFGAGSPGVARHDRTTWGINVGTNSPVHLTAAAP